MIMIVIMIMNTQFFTFCDHDHENNMFRDHDHEKCHLLGSSPAFCDHDCEFSSNFTIIIMRLDSTFELQLHESITFSF